MLDWIANLLGFASNFPWRRPIVGLGLGVIGALITWYFSDLPFANIALGFGIATGIWVYLESLGHSTAGATAGFGAGLIAFWLTSGFGAVQKTIQNAPPVKCVYFDQRTPEECHEILEKSKERNG
ncbi:hypothetical protein [Bosea massiliensis]|uniref:Uncharacterized protein n=1 Tax=Bosea massiliensis TaxID=151419 RepID=A0ABW0NYV5_9HYPH